MRPEIRTFLFAFLFIPLAVCAAVAAPPIASPKWVGAWAASQQVPEPENALPQQALRDITLRQIVHLSVGGPMIRIRLSNAFGNVPLQISAVHVARPLSPASSRIDAASDRALLFIGQSDITIPAGAEYISNPIDYPVKAQSDLAITMYLDAVPEQETSHPGSRATTYIASGLHSSAAELPSAQTVDHWYFLSGVDVAATPDAAALVILGDSITDGHGTTTNGNDRWTDVLARRLLQSPPGHDVAVLNAGLGGNRLLADGKGPNALARFDRDVLGQTGVRYLIVEEGVNDLGMLTRDGPAAEHQHNELVGRIIGAYAQIVASARAHGIKVIGATIMPYYANAFYHPDQLNEADRTQVNAWIRAPGNFDAVVDFDKVVADSAQPLRLRAEYDGGDHLHLSLAGYRAIAGAVPLSLFQK
jgi:lysophospholipase L1-like esterase